MGNLNNKLISLRNNIAKVTIAVCRKRHPFRLRIGNYIRYEHTLYAKLSEITFVPSSHVAHKLDRDIAIGPRESELLHRNCKQIDLFDGYIFRARDAVTSISCFRGDCCCRHSDPRIQCWATYSCSPMLCYTSHHNITTHPLVVVNI